MATASELRRRPPSWRDRFDPVVGRARKNLLRTGAIFAAISLIFLWILYTKPSIPVLSNQGTKLTAEFGYASNLYPGRTPVRVHGIDVGFVKKVERAPSGRGVRVEMRIKDDKGVSLHQDASMAIRWRTALGRNMYMDLVEGSPSAPPLKDNFIPRSRTSNQVELDTALEPLDANGRRSFQTMITEFDQVFRDPKPFQNAIDAVEPAMRQTARGLRALRGTKPGEDLPNLIAGTNGATRALARDEKALAGVIDHGNVALGVTAARRADLAAMLQAAPAALRETRTTMTRLVRTLDDLDPLATKLVPGARKLAGTARRAQDMVRVALPLLRELRPTMRALRPAVRDLGRASTAGTPSFGPLTNIMRRAESTFIPFLKSKDAETGRITYQAIGPAVGSASAALALGDKYRAMATFEANAGDSIVSGFGPCKTYLADPTVPLAQKIQCELMTRAYVAAILGKNPDQIQIKNSVVPPRTLDKYIRGKAGMAFGKFGRKK